MTLQLKKFQDLLDDHDSFTVVWAIKVPGSLQIGIHTTKESLINLLPLIKDDLDYVYSVYEYVPGPRIILIHHMGTFAECCRIVDGAG